MDFKNKAVDAHKLKEIQTKTKEANKEAEDKNAKLMDELNHFEEHQCVGVESAIDSGAAELVARATIALWICTTERERAHWI